MKSQNIHARRKSQNIQHALFPYVAYSCTSSSSSFSSLSIDLSTTNTVVAFPPSLTVTFPHSSDPYIVYRGVLPLLRSAPVRASHAESIEESIQFAVEHAKAKRLCKPGDAVVALHGANADMIKICL